MRPRILGLCAFVLAIWAVSCSKGGGGAPAGAGLTPTVAPGWNAGTGATPSGATSSGASPASPGDSTPPGAAVQASFETTFSAGATTITLAGHSCDVAGGAWLGEVSASGGGSGSGAISFDLPAGTDGAKTSWSFEGQFDGGPASYGGTGHVYKSGPADAPRLQFFGLIVVTTGSTDARGPANATADVILGPVDACG